MNSRSQRSKGTHPWKTRVDGCQSPDDSSVLSHTPHCEGQGTPGKCVVETERISSLLFFANANIDARYVLKVILAIVDVCRVELGVEIVHLNGAHGDMF